LLAEKLEAGLQTFPLAADLLLPMLLLLEKDGGLRLGLVQGLETLLSLLVVAQADFDALLFCQQLGIGLGLGLAGGQLLLQPLHLAQLLLLLLCLLGLQLLAFLEQMLLLLEEVVEMAILGHQGLVAFVTRQDVFTLGDQLFQLEQVLSLGTPLLLGVL
jgi:hypothetical protein